MHKIGLQESIIPTSKNMFQLLHVDNRLILDAKELCPTCSKQREIGERGLTHGDLQ